MTKTTTRLAGAALAAAMLTGPAAAATLIGDEVNVAISVGNLGVVFDTDVTIVDPDTEISLLGDRFVIDLSGDEVFVGFDVGLLPRFDLPDITIDITGLDPVGGGVVDGVTPPATAPGLFTATNTADSVSLGFSDLQTGFGGNLFGFDIQFAVIPIPASASLLGAGMVAFAALGWRRRKS